MSVAVTKHHGLGGLSNGRLFSHGSGGCTPTVRGLQVLFLARSPFLTCRWPPLCPIALPLHMVGGLVGGHSCVSSSSSKDSRPVGLGPTLMMSLKDLSPNIVTLAIRASTSELGVGLGMEVSPGGCDGAVICIVLTGRNSVSPLPLHRYEDRPLKGSCSFSNTARAQPPASESIPLFHTALHVRESGRLGAIY